jgi:hypothetical protein
VLPSAYHADIEGQVPQDDTFAMLRTQRLCWPALPVLTIAAVVSPVGLPHADGAVPNSLHHHAAISASTHFDKNEY